MTLGLRTYAPPGPGNSIQGGGYYGLFDSQSIQGGGSVASVTIALANCFAGNASSTKTGIFIKVGSLPASDMTIMDLNSGVNGYLRLKLTSAGAITAEASYRGYTNSLILNPITAVVTGTWHYITSSWGSNGNNFQFWCIGQVTAAGGVTDGLSTNSVATAASIFKDTYTATLGMGTSQSSAYLPFPNTGGNELKALQGSHATNADCTTYAVPTSDPGAGGDYLYLCRDTVGVQTSIVDSSGNGKTLTAGSQGITVVSDGPYA